MQRDGGRPPALLLLLPLAFEVTANPPQQNPPTIQAEGRLCWHLQLFEHFLGIRP